MHGGEYGWGMGYGGVFMIVFWIALIAVVAYIVQSIRRKNDRAARRDTPRDILNARYAKGEITREEYERIKDDLKKA